MPTVSIDKPIRILETFAGYGSQSMALRNLGAEFEHYRVVEFDEPAIKSYNAVHGTNFPAMDIRDIHAEDLGVVEKDKYTYLLTYSFPCFTADTLVLTDKGFKKISDVTVGDRVFTHDRTFQTVKKSMYTGQKETYFIKGMSFHEIRCTDNHKFYVRKMVRHYPTYKNGKRGRIREFLPAEWVECKNLNKNYYMGIAINNNSVIPEWNGITFDWSDGRKNRTKNELADKLDRPDFWWLIGRYVGDGWHRSQGGIVICAAHDETPEITDVAERLGFTYSIANERTVDKIHFSIKELEYFVEPFGRGAENKVIPGFVIDLPENLVKAFVDGYVSADGTFTQGRFKTSSVSKELSYGIGQCVAKAYHTPFSLYKNKRSEKSVIEGRTINQKDDYQVVWKTEKKKQDQAFYEDGYIWFPIQTISKTNLVEKVYDIEVENSHSFMANGVIAHNCTDISVAGAQKGFAEGSETRSALLWEVRRILDELKEIDALPQILLMENVTAIHSTENQPHFAKWLTYLESIGYSTYVSDLNASDYGVAQNRDRTFAVSILGEYNYNFLNPVCFHRPVLQADLRLFQT